MPRWILLTALPLFAATCLLATLAMAQPADSKIPTAESAGKILLANGELLTGHAQREVDTIVITTERGATIRIPEHDVLHIGTTSLETFLFLRRGADSGRVGELVKLARWALEHNLLDECAVELARARQLDPTYQGIGTLDERLAQARARLASDSVTHHPLKISARDRHVPATVVPSNAPRTSPRRYAELNRLERSQVASFTRHMQPLLLNRCATAGCHGRASPSDFQLHVPTRDTGLRSLQSIANFEATMRFIDLTDPTDSRLLTSLRNNDTHLEVWISAPADGTLLRLTQWIQSVAAPGVATPIAGGSSLDPPSSPAAGIQPSTSTTTPVDQRLGLPAADPGPVGKVGPGDPYDPAPFNRHAPRRPAKPPDAQ